MKLLIIGSRCFEHFDLAEYIPENVELIISGGAKGIDSIAEKLADEHNISKLIIRPNYKLYGKAAPLKRNEQMIDIADEILVIWDGHSKGTKYSINYAKKYNKPLKVITIAEKTDGS